MARHLQFLCELCVCVCVCGGGGGVCARVCARGACLRASEPSQRNFICESRLYERALFQSLGLSRSSSVSPPPHHTAPSLPPHATHPSCPPLFSGCRDSRCHSMNTAFPPLARVHSNAMHACIASLWGVRGGGEAAWWWWGGSKQEERA
jgi:hypothetical protein